MNRNDISSTLDDIDADLSEVTGQAQKKAVSVLLNIVEDSVSKIEKLEKEKQSLKDEVNRLKGEQGKPDVKANKNNTDGDISYPA